MIERLLASPASDDDEGDEDEVPLLVDPYPTEDIIPQPPPPPERPYAQGSTPHPPGQAPRPSAAAAA
eukprot:3117482-Alexandrium_andersonii.AAC.1